jgi:hypothetical protein
MLDKSRLLERVAQILAHRVCTAAEHDVSNGKIHGYCIVCAELWPCEYAGKPPTEDFNLQGALE